MKLLLVDDHALFLQGISLIFEARRPDYQVVQANCAELAQQKLNQHIDIDLILVDLSMPKMDGIAFIKDILQHGFDIPFAVLSANTEADKIAQVLNIGASGFLPKSLNAEELLAAIDSMIAGEIFIPKQQIDSNEPKIKDQFTHRQRQIIDGLIAGQTNNEIATQLCISSETVKSHLKLIYKKLEVKNRSACIREVITMNRG